MTSRDWLPLLFEMAAEADRIALRWFEDPSLRVLAKEDRSPVSEADRAIERAVRLRAEREGLDVLGEEEGGTARTAAPRLIVDPIDGTRNFVRGIPVFATLLAIEEDNDVTAGVVSAPALGQRWHAARGHGAFRGGHRLQVSRIDTLAGAQLFHPGLGGTSERIAPGLPRLVSRVERSRGFGDFWQHVLVAQGSGEAAVDPAVSAWDVAAVVVIVEEAGGRATTLAGTRDIHGGSLVTSNGLLHDEVLGALAT